MTKQPRLSFVGYWRSKVCNSSDCLINRQQASLYVSQKGHKLLLRTILRARASLGWVFRGSTYCQTIREGNKVKRFEWCQEYQQDNFDNVIWTDESSIQLETHRRTCCRKPGQPPKPKPRPKHPVKVHVLGGNQCEWSCSTVHT